MSDDSLLTMRPVTLSQSTRTETRPSWKLSRVIALDGTRRAGTFGPDATPARSSLGRAGTADRPRGPGVRGRAARQAVRRLGAAPGARARRARADRLRQRPHPG